MRTTLLLRRRRLLPVPTPQLWEAACCSSSTRQQQQQQQLRHYTTPAARSGAGGGGGFQRHSRPRGGASITTTTIPWQHMATAAAAKPYCQRYSAAAAAAASSSSTSAAAAAAAATKGTTTSRSDRSTTTAATTRTIAETLSADINTRAKQLPRVYTTNQTPAAHSHKDIGLWYQLTDTAVVTHLPKKLIDKQLAEVFEMTDFYMAIREMPWNIVQDLKRLSTSSSAAGEEEESSGNSSSNSARPAGNKGAASNNDNAPPRIRAGHTVALHGLRGTGKTCALNYLAQYARSPEPNGQQWLLLAVDAAEASHMQAGLLTKARDASAPFLFDQPHETQTFFERIAHTEMNALATVKLKLDYQEYANLVPASVETPGGLIFDSAAEGGVVQEAVRPAELKTLLDLVELGARSQHNAPRVLRDFVKEVQQANEVRVLVLIDGINQWDADSVYVDPTRFKGHIPAKDLALVSSLKSLVWQPPSNGVTVCALTAKAGYASAKLILDAADVVLQTSPYDEPELIRALLHFASSEVLCATISDELVARMRIITGGNPWDVFEMSMMY